MKTINLFLNKALAFLYVALVLIHAIKDKMGWSTAAFFICYAFILRGRK